MPVRTHDRGLWVAWAGLRQWLCLPPWLRDSFIQSYPTLSSSVWLLQHLSFKHFILWLPCPLSQSFPVLPRLQMDLLSIFPITIKLSPFPLISSPLFPAKIPWSVITVTGAYTLCSSALTTLKPWWHLLSTLLPPAPMQLNSAGESLIWFHFKIKILHLSWALNAAKQSYWSHVLSLPRVCLYHVSFIVGSCSERWLSHTFFFFPDLRHLHFLTLRCEDTCCSFLSASLRKLIFPFVIYILYLLSMF